MRTSITLLFIHTFCYHPQLWYLHDINTHKNMIEVTYHDTSVITHTSTSSCSIPCSKLKLLVLSEVFLSFMYFKNYTRHKNAGN